MNEFFDDAAKTWDDDPSKLERAHRFADLIAQNVELTGTEQFLDYGSGTGLLTQALAERIGPATLADPSAGMREVMEQKAKAGLFGEHARIWDFDATRDAVPEDKFDLIGTALVLHHVSDINAALTGFHNLLTPGGVVCAIDLDEDGGGFHAHMDDFHGHHGFNRETLREKLTSAGFRDIEFHEAGTLQRGDNEFSVFLAVAQRG